MKRILAVILVSAVCVGAERAAAGTLLASGPLINHGLLTCGCTNLTSEPIQITLELRHQSQSAGTSPITLAPGGSQVISVSSASISVGNCVVARTDGKSASTKQLACNLATRDAGITVAVVPVDRKLKP